MAATGRNSGSLKGVLVVTVLVAVGSLIELTQGLSPDLSSAPPIVGEAGSAVQASPGMESADGSTGGVGGPRLDAATTCVNVGYLCAEVEISGSLQIIRWPDDTEVIRVRVPLPEHEPPARARELQRAAIRGIQAWQGHPFDLAIHSRSREDPADIVVSWHRQLEGTRIGQARLEWTQRGSEITLRVKGLDLVTHSPRDPRRQIPPRQIELTAAHEMGHALGLPHSDDRHDVMYPRNTASHLSNADYRTMVAVYRLPNGAVIER